MSDSRNGGVLDEEQRAAVETDDVAIAVLAGPGSGKTRVLSHRARRLLNLNPTHRALLLTFTNKAAAEMKARAIRSAAIPSERMWASTFHTFCMMVLHAHGDLVGISREFEILDDEERAELSGKVAADAGLVDHFRRWSYLRLRRQNVHEVEVKRFGELYTSAKASREALDFDDLIVLTADLFESHDEVATAYASRYPHLLVDEFQDTNAAQFAIVQALAAPSLTVSVFADDDQAIYRFAGAEAENVRRFVTTLGATVFPLTINYRCRKAIVDRANRLIAADPQASGRQMRPAHEGGEVRNLSFATVDAEARGIADEIHALVNGRERAPADIAVLGRAAHRLTPVLAELARRGVPTSNWLTPNYDSPERRALRVCLPALRGEMNAFQARRLVDFLRLPNSDVRNPQELLEANSDMPQCRALLEARRLAWDGAAVRDVVLAIQLTAASVDESTGASFGALIDAVAAFEANDPSFSLEHLLAELVLGSVDGPPTSGGGVKVATFHRTKGLQWPHVYLLGLEQGRLPDFRADTTEKIRDERRTCFVGVCRAELRLTLTHVERFGGHLQTPSQFIREMGF